MDINPFPPQQTRMESKTYIFAPPHFAVLLTHTKYYMISIHTRTIMKDTFLTVLSFGAVGFVLVSAAPVPAGGFYPPPNFPGSGGGGFWPGFPSGPGGGGGIGFDLPQMCNCNNPSTKETVVEPFCTQGGGREEYRVFSGVEPIKQHMVIKTRAFIYTPKSKVCCVRACVCVCVCVCFADSAFTSMIYSVL